MLDSLAERYGMLPSQVLERASTLDLWVFDVAVSYKNYVQRREMNKNNPGSMPESFDSTQLQQGLEKFRANTSRQ